jgi:ABC-type maltose transport system permease subunit
VFAAIAVYPALTVGPFLCAPRSSAFDVAGADSLRRNFKHYVELFTNRPFLLWMRNSLSCQPLLPSRRRFGFDCRYVSLAPLSFRTTALTAILTTQMFPATMLLLADVHPHESPWVC